MAIPRKMPVEFATVFPFGAYMVGEISPVRDYDRSTKENVVQATDPDTGLRSVGGGRGRRGPGGDEVQPDDDGQGPGRCSRCSTRPRATCRSGRWSSQR